LEEGFMVANKISEMRLSAFDSFNDFVILYRTNAQSRIFEESLRKRNLPYRVYGGLSFYQRKEIKDVIAYLRLILNDADEEAFKRIINYPVRGIGDTTLQKLIHAASQNGVSLWAVLNDIPQYNVPINGGTAKKLEGFRLLIESFHPLVGSKNVFELTQRLLKDSGIQREVEEDQSPETLSRKENIQALLGGMNEFVLSRTEEGNEAVFLTDYLQEVSLLTDQDESKNNEGERITLMTIHAAKGLEFKNVFVAGLEEDIFPSSHSLESEKDLEEERRLLYVAITRAESVCVLSYAKSRFRNGQNNFTRPSRFLKDLDPTLLDYPSESPMYGGSEQAETYQQRTFQPKRTFEEAPKLVSYGTPVSSSGKPLQKVKHQPAVVTSTAAGFASDITGLKVGSTIAHERFGKGVVKSLEGSGDNAKVEVEFETSGYKKLLLKFARFTILS
jgi:DNA helicase-2/ATP-dependent DNA helicase PcrA